MDTNETMRATMDGLTQIYPGCAVVLLVAPNGAPEGQRVNYISSGHRAEMIAMMKEVVARFEGRAHPAPEARQ